jgi:ABC-type antimicrobial peptide transport system permease subunit
MKTYLQKLIRKFVLTPDSSSRTYCPVCDNDIKTDSPHCPECGSERKSGELTLHKPIILYANSKPSILKTELRPFFFYGVLHLIFYSFVVYIVKEYNLYFIPQNSDTLDWFFSTITQSYIALIAVLVTVVSFRLQTNLNEINNLSTKVHSIVFEIIGEDSYKMTNDDAVSFVRSSDLEEFGELSKHKIASAKKLSETIKLLKRSSKTNIERLKKTFVACTFAALCSLVFLLVVDYIVLIKFEIVAVIIVMQAVLLSTYFAWQLVKSLR